MSDSLHNIPQTRRAGNRVRWAALALHTSPEKVLNLAVAKFFADLTRSDERLNELKIVLAEADRSA